MLARHTIAMSALCPVDDLPDHYEVTVETARVVKVEDILAAIEPYRERKAFQEEITIELAKRLRCKVTTIGFHSGVRTEVVA